MVPRLRPTFSATTPGPASRWCFRLLALLAGVALAPGPAGPLGPAPTAIAPGGVPAPAWARCGAVFAAGQAPRYRQHRELAQDGERVWRDGRLERVVHLCKAGGPEPFFAVAFNLARGIPDYVAFRAGPREPGARVPGRRQNAWFAPDPALGTRGGAVQASTRAYAASGFDRGHLVPAAAMKWDRQAWRQTFLYSAVVPQRPAFNRGGWRKAEAFTRALVRQRVFSRLWVVTGVYGELDSPVAALPTVPACFYKVWIGQLETGELTALAVLMANTDRLDANTRLEDHILDLDALQAQADMEFLPHQSHRGVDRARWRLTPPDPTRASGVVCP